VGDREGGVSRLVAGTGNENVPRPKQADRAGQQQGDRDEKGNLFHCKSMSRRGTVSHQADLPSLYSNLVKEAQLALMGKI